MLCPYDYLYLTKSSYNLLYLKNANNRVIVRAWDSAGNTQPENIRDLEFQGIYE
ncbi:hypothetical protein [Nostoc sp.]|uniref:hypothetical protein n=1 Tax=Nostoc sp. TaxID=1180 RepID=UPI002FFC77DE